MVEVTYHCPRCEAVATLERGAYLADKCVTPEPLDGWEYLPAHEAIEVEAGSASGADSDDEEPAGPDADDPYAGADGVEIVCGAAETDGEGCGRPYYLSFVRFEDGVEQDPRVPVADANFDFLR
ncbi:MAG: hypothetical protein ABEI11_02010 [Haloarculaceae archaeon]